LSANPNVVACGFLHWYGRDAILQWSICACSLFVVERF